jgi:hypothetical protein
VVRGVLATAAVGAALAMDALAKKFGLSVPWWIDSPSVLGLFAILHRLYDRTVWGAISFSYDFQGTWTGWTDSTHHGGTRIAVVVHIRQTWTEIQVTLETESSVSQSLMAAVHTRDASRPGLSYEFFNEPKTRAAAETMHAHRGTVALRLGPNSNHLEGDYYTGRDRANLGSISLTRVSREFLARGAALALLERSEATSAPV